MCTKTQSAWRGVCGHRIENNVPTFQFRTSFFAWPANLSMHSAHSKHTVRWLDSTLKISVCLFNNWIMFSVQCSRFTEINRGKFRLSIVGVCNLIDDACRFKTLFMHIPSKLSHFGFDLEHWRLSKFVHRRRVQYTYKTTEHWNRLAEMCSHIIIINYYVAAQSPECDVSRCCSLFAAHHNNP